MCFLSQGVQFTLEMDEGRHVPEPVRPDVVGREDDASPFDPAWPQPDAGLTCI